MKKIMMVDDEPDQIYTVKQILEKLGGDYEIIPADSGEQCLEMLKNIQAPDLILLDIMMLGMSGWETFNRLKENPAWESIPVIFLTARTDWVAENAGRFFAEDYIKKPFRSEDLKKRIDKVLNSKN